MKQNLLLPLLVFLGITNLISQPYIDKAYQDYIDKYPVGQALTTWDKMMLSSLPEMEASGDDLRRELPYMVDNSALPHMRPVLFQMGASCGQACAVGHNFTYEINAVRGLPADTSSNQYATHFTWNFMNGGKGWYGVSYFHSFEILRLCGNPNVNDYGGSYYDDGKRWMTGYDAYYNSMKNRIAGAYKIKTDTEEGILALKNWVYDHLGKSVVGGVASFYANVPYNAVLLNDTTPEGGKHVLTEWYPNPTHALTVVGYNDSVRWDYNGDGMYTNHLDLNEDGVIDPKDWEIGAVKIVNSHGVNQLDSGYCYMMYKVLAEDIEEGGIWNQAVHIVDAISDYEPELTLKIQLEHDSRQAIRVRAGISNDTTDAMPSEILSFPIFNYQGGHHYMQGYDTAEYYKTIEFGLDITPLQKHIPTGEPVKFFLLVDENDPEHNGFGSIVSCSLMDYSSGSANEVPFGNLPAGLENNSLTAASLIHSVDAQKVEISTNELPPFTEGEAYSAPISATGGVTPYKWLLEKTYHVHTGSDNFPLINEQLILPGPGNDSTTTLVLPFSFPFYGKKHDSIYVNAKGFLQFEKNNLPWPYLEDYHLMLKTRELITPMVSKAFMPDEVWYSENTDSVSFRWKVRIDKNDLTGNYEFAATLFKDGRIKFNYSDFDELDFLHRASGISAGNNHSYTFTPFGSDNIVLKNHLAEFIPQSFPDGIYIDDSGILQGIPENSEKIYDITVTATDRRNVAGTKTFSFSNGLVAHFMPIAGDDDRIEYGEAVEIDFTVKNNRETTINGLNIDMTSSNPHITITDNSEFIGNLAPGQEKVITKAFSFDVNTDIPDKEKLYFEASLNSEGQLWKKELVYEAFSPVLTVENFQVIDHDNLIEPGQTADLFLSIRNTGHSSVNEVTAELISGHPAIVINNTGPQEYGTIRRGETSEKTFSISAGQYLPLGHKTTLKCLMLGESTNTFEDSIEINIGHVPVAVIDLDPNSHSAPRLFETIREMDIIAEYWQKLPPDISDYQCLFISLGVFYSKHELTWAQGAELAEYLDNGGSIYMEGRETWLDDLQTPVHNRFGIVPEGSLTVFDTVRGADSTFMEGLSLLSESVHPLNFYWLEPDSTTEAFSVIENTSEGKSCAIALKTSGYKTIGSVTDLGTLIPLEPIGARGEMIKRILDFFEVAEYVTGIENKGENLKERAVLAYPNPFSNECYLNISAHNSGDATISVYNITGRLIGSFTESNLHKGDNIISLDKIPGLTGNLTPGIYFYSVKVNREVFNGKIIKL